ncbi:hypothetical protein [Plantibacter cousiniae (nom. nud.)]|uniref:Uncharacterized protein n=1 Tax=Plantibacter cousiniae (nom. nud.) TaxID=199709 RepID=A0ABY1LJ32_9MICO|nr:hypothetical protein [Plantibacter cousiniae]SKC47515.1 hypothetical protein SAMN06295973_1255 [Plantibacter cousiniae]
MTTSAEAIASFRNSWLGAEGEDFASRMARRSLASFAEQQPDLRPLLFELEHKAQSELDIHLDGKTVGDHEADAAAFASLVRGIAEATKEIAKHALGRQRRPSTLRVLAPMPGSVRLVLRAAEPTEVDGGRTMQVTRTPSIDSRSLDTVAILLARADSEDVVDDDDVLSGLAADLPARAHFGLKRAARAIDEQDWEVTGELRSVRGFQPVHVGPKGARALMRALDEKHESTTEVVLSGVIDGQRRSIGALWFAPDGSAPFEAAVPSAELIEQVVQHDAANEVVQATFDVLTIVGGGAAPRQRKVYTLRSMVRIPSQPSFPLDETLE